MAQHMSSALLCPQRRRGTGPSTNLGASCSGEIPRADSETSGSDNRRIRCILPLPVPRIGRIAGNFDVLFFGIEQRVVRFPRFRAKTGSPKLCPLAHQSDNLMLHAIRRGRVCPAPRRQRAPGRQSVLPAQAGTSSSCTTAQAWRSIA